jgi:PHD/YefM family antitoxin component YafN of YafNO toxin-antitoxin module
MTGMSEELKTKMAIALFKEITWPHETLAELVISAIDRGGFVIISRDEFERLQEIEERYDIDGVLK